MFRRKKQVVQGHHLPSPRLTLTGVRLLLQYIALPILLVLTLIDGLLYLFFRFALDSCYGVWCLI